MMICPGCTAEIVDIDKACESCCFRPETIDGFVAWAPEMVGQEVGFPAENFPALASVEAKHFWFRARNSLIIWALKKYFPEFNSLLEVGCGTGFVLSGIAQSFPGARLVGSEIFTAGLVFAAQRMPEVELLQADARRLPFADEFEIVSALDVIEHVKEDDLVLSNLYRAVKPGGGCLITVPQHRWLWSSVDDAACHERRYAVADLHRKIESAGFRILASTSFVTLLLPVMLLSRLLNRCLARSAGVDELQLNPVTNAFLQAIMGLERLTIMLGVRWRVGGSRLVVACKPRS
jgi:ubiquinone/menaquinone biosynthesis C-methylase UbiE